jgi:hypothetical protein
MLKYVFFAQYLGFTTLKFVKMKFAAILAVYYLADAVYNIFCVQTSDMQIKWREKECKL